MRFACRLFVPWGELADRAPVIVIDTREQEPLAFERLASVRGTLQTGDYSVAGLQDLFSIERKTVSDLVGCCMGENRDRFERELHRLRGYRFKRLLVVGSEAEILAGQYHSNIKPKRGAGQCVGVRDAGTISRSCLCRRRGARWRQPPKINQNVSFSEGQLFLPLPLQAVQQAPIRYARFHLRNSGPCPIYRRRNRIFGGCLPSAS
jgi:hypothetical protein